MADNELPEWQTLARSVTESDRARHTLPPRVWENIQASIAEDDSSAPDTEHSSAEHSSAEHSSAEKRGSLTPSTSPSLPRVPVSNASHPEGDDEIVPPEDVLDLRADRRQPSAASYRKSRRRVLLASAASVLAIVAGLSLLGLGGANTDNLFATVTNETLSEAYNGTATATLERGDAPTLRIAFDTALPTSEPVELWLITSDLSDMRSLGIVEPGDTSWAWPTDLDPAEYSIVDLSIEPNNGDPTHSGRSILQGQLSSS